MARLSGCAISLSAMVVLATPVMAMEPLQRSIAQSSGQSSALASTTPLDLSSEQAHFSTTKTLSSEQSAQKAPAAPGEKGRVPQGHSLLDLSF